MLMEYWQIGWVFGVFLFLFLGGVDNRYIAVHFLATLSMLVDEGTHPEEWSKAIIRLYRLDYITVLSHCNQYTGNSGCFSLGKRAATVRRRYPAVLLLLLPLPVCMHCFRFPMPPAVRPTLLRQMDMGSLTCARAAHTKGGRVHTSLHGN